MKHVRVASLAVGSLVLLSASACTSVVRGGGFPRSGQKSSVEGSVAVLPVRGNLFPQGAGADWEGLSRILERTAQEAWPGQLVDSEPLLRALGSPDPSTALSDYELVTAGRALSLDTVCVLNVSAYYSTFEILVPPFWKTETNTVLSVRVLDTKTGSLVLEGTRASVIGGYFRFRSREDLPDVLEHDVRVLLGLPKLDS